MSFDLSIVMNTKPLLKKLQRIQSEVIPRALSNASERAVKKGRKAVIQDLKDNLHEPIPALLKEGRGGWVWIDFAFRKEVKKTGEASGKVFINGPTRKAKDIKRAQEIVHRNAYGTLERSAPLDTPFIVEPSKRLLKTRSIRGVPLKIDAYGNVRGYRAAMNKVMNDKTGKYLNVKLGQKYKLGGGKVLRPGLYLRETKAVRYKTNKATGRRGAPYKGKKLRETTKFTAILRYFPIRKYKRSWNFKRNAIKAMQKEYADALPVEFKKALKRELLK